MPDLDFDAEFNKELERFGLEHPEFLPNAVDKLTLQHFWLHGLTLGTHHCQSILKEALDESNSSRAEDEGSGEGS